MLRRVENNFRRNREPFVRHSSEDETAGNGRNKIMKHINNMRVEMHDINLDLGIGFMASFWPRSDA